MERASSSLDEASKSEGNGALLPAVVLFHLCASMCHAEDVDHLLKLPSVEIVPQARCCSNSGFYHTHSTCAVRLSAEKGVPCMVGKQIQVRFLLGSKQMQTRRLQSPNNTLS